MAIEMKGIDVSKHNGVIDWDKVKAAGIEFAILRAGYGRKDPKQIDPMFERNYAECKRVGIPVGAYHYSYADSPADALLEAEFFLEIIQGKKFEFPVIFDIEDKSQENLGMTTLTNMCLMFCDRVEDAGYYTAIYANTDWLKNKLDYSRLQKYDIWLADWRKKEGWGKPHGMWQYTDSGKVSGISTKVDMNLAYKNYPRIIKGAGLNNFRDKFFTVTGVQEHLDENKAKTLSCQLRNLGMTVVMKEEE